jgi:hypothetical protein
MYFSIFNFCIRESLKEISLCTLSFQPNEQGSDRYLLCFRLENIKNFKFFSIHFLFNWNFTWTIRK